MTHLEHEARAYIEMEGADVTNVRFMPVVDTGATSRG